jgi:hypothetical protein
MSPGTGAQRVPAPGSGRAPIPGTGAQRVPGPGSGPQRVLAPGSGPQRVLAPGSGPQRVLAPGSGPQRVLPPGSGPQRVLAPGSGPQRVLAPGSGPQRVLAPGSGPQRVLAPGTGAQAAAGRTPVRGFPPVNPVPPGPPGREQPPPAQEAPGPWHTPRTPVPGDADADAAGHGYDEDDQGQRRPDEPAGRAATARSSRRRAARTAGPRRRPRTAWLATAVAVVLAAGGFAAYKYLYEPRVDAPVSPSLRLPTTVPGSPGFDKALGKWQHIGTRAEDPEPLTLQALYPPRFTLDGSSYTRTAASATRDCTLAVYGSQLQAALQSGHCTQVLRASYISGSGTMMGTVGVVNLSTASAAQDAGRVTGPQEIIAPLSSSQGPTSKLGTGTGVVQAEIKGHYLILMWTEFTSLDSPSTAAARQQLEQFAANLVTGSANIDLSTRMLTGKP